MEVSELRRRFESLAENQYAYRERRYSEWLEAENERLRRRLAEARAALQEAPCYPNERCLPNQPPCRRHQVLVVERGQTTKDSDG